MLSQWLKKNKKITAEIENLSYVENCIIDNSEKEWVLKVNYSFENEELFLAKLPRYVKAILTIVQKYEPKALFDIHEEKEVFRKVVYLKGLDCAHCAARIESIAKRQFDHEQLIVDFATTRFIIETTDKELADDIVEAVENDFEQFGINNNKTMMFTPIGQYDVCPEGTYKVALVLYSNQDYHWYRQNPNGLWSHKFPGDQISDVDPSGNLIIDPQISNQKFIQGDYDIFVGYFAVTPWNVYYTGPDVPLE